MIGCINHLCSWDAGRHSQRTEIFHRLAGWLWPGVMLPRWRRRSHVTTRSLPMRPYEGCHVLKARGVSGWHGRQMPCYVTRKRANHAGLLVAHPHRRLSALTVLRRSSKLADVCSPLARVTRNSAADLHELINPGLRPGQQPNWRMAARTESANGTASS